MSKSEKLNNITETIIGVAINIHRELGPGLLESAYEVCMVYDLAHAGLKVEQQKPLPVVYRGVRLECAYRLDLVVEDEVIVEIKSVEKLLPIHQVQLMSYLKLFDYKVGLLINFNVKVLKNGIKRVVNDFPDSLRAQQYPRKMVNPVRKFRRGFTPLSLFLFSYHSKWQIFLSNGVNQR